jgi:hypothetical protein
MSEFEDKLNSILSSPKEMEKILELARSFSGSETAGTAEVKHEGKEPIPGMGDFDPQMLGMLGRLMKEYTTAGGDEKLEILRMMKPYLKEERQTGLLKALEIAKIAKMAKIAFSELSGGEKNS